MSFIFFGFFGPCICTMWVYLSTEIHVYTALFAVSIIIAVSLLALMVVLVCLLRRYGVDAAGVTFEMTLAAVLLVTISVFVALPSLVWHSIFDYGVVITVGGALCNLIFCWHPVYLVFTLARKTSRLSSSVSPENPSHVLTHFLTDETDSGIFLKFLCASHCAENMLFYNRVCAFQTDYRNKTSHEVAMHAKKNTHTHTQHS